MSKEVFMILGGSRYVIPAIKIAQSLGYQVVTCDYLPGNIAHQFSDTYRNVDITDEVAVLQIAEEMQISGITSFATDPGVTTAAYVADSLKLHFPCSRETAVILQNKTRFREFLLTNKFNTPRAISIPKSREVRSLPPKIGYPAIVKPVDSAGSKGVRKVTDDKELFEALEKAYAFSKSGTCIVEQYIEKIGPQFSIEGFIQGGLFSWLPTMDQVFDSEGPNPHAPIGNTFPSSIDGPSFDYLTQELQRLAALLELRTGLYNIEVRIGLDGAVYIMEISPRGGGNRLAELIHAATGINLIEHDVRAALGFPSIPFTPAVVDGIWHQRVLQSRTPGRYQGLNFEPSFEKSNLREVSVWVKQDAQVNEFTAATHAIGTIRAKFSESTEYEEFMSSPQEFFQIGVSAT